MQSASLDSQFRLAFWIFGLLFIAGQLVIFLLLLPRRHDRGFGQQRAHGDWCAELTWTAAVAVLFFAFNIYGERLWSAMKFQEPESGALQIEVTGAQFQWYFRYPGPDGKFGRIDPVKLAKPNEGNPLGLDPADPAGQDDVVSTSLVLPLGRDVDLLLRSHDVIHSLFIPAMRFKQDTVPGLDVHAHFKPTAAGNYEIACAELCGLGHYRMRSFVRVVPQQQIEEWLRSQGKP